jgi:hypothetical protein
MLNESLVVGRSIELRLVLWIASSISVPVTASAKVPTQTCQFRWLERISAHKLGVTLTGVARDWFRSLVVCAK